MRDRPSSVSGHFWADLCEEGGSGPGDFAGLRAAWASYPVNPSPSWARQRDPVESLPSE